MADILLDWTCDCDQQPAVMDNNVALIEAFSDSVVASVQPPLEVYTGAVPGTGLWKSEEIKKYGTNVIPDGSSLLWKDTGTGVFGGGFTALNNAIYPADCKYGKGKEYAVLTPSYIDGYGIIIPNSFSGVNNPMVSWTFSVPVTSYVDFTIQFTTLSVNGTLLRMTYYLDGTNQYHSEFGTAGALDCYRSITISSVPVTTTFLYYWKHYQTLAPGIHTLDFRVASTGINNYFTSVYTPRMNSPIVAPGPVVPQYSFNLSSFLRLTAV